MRIITVSSTDKLNKTAFRKNKKNTLSLRDGFHSLTHNAQAFHYDLNCLLNCNKPIQIDENQVKQIEEIDKKLFEETRIGNEIEKKPPNKSIIHELLLTKPTFSKEKMELKTKGLVKERNKKKKNLKETVLNNLYPITDLPILPYPKLNSTSTNRPLFKEIQEKKASQFHLQESEELSIPNSITRESLTSKKSSNSVELPIAELSIPRKPIENKKILSSRRQTFLQEIEFYRNSPEILLNVEMEQKTRRKDNEASLAVNKIAINKKICQMQSFKSNKQVIDRKQEK